MGIFLLSGDRYSSGIMNPFLYPSLSFLPSNSSVVFSSANLLRNFSLSKLKDSACLRLYYSNTLSHSSSFYFDSREAFRLLKLAGCHPCPYSSSECISNYEWARLCLAELEMIGSKRALYRSEIKSLEGGTYISLIEGLFRFMIGY